MLILLERRGWFGLTVVVIPLLNYRARIYFERVIRTRSGYLRIILGLASLSHSLSEQERVARVDALSRFEGLRRVWGFARRPVVVGVLAYLLVLLLLMIFEKYLIYPGTYMEGGDWKPDGFVFESAFFESADGTMLHGWYLDHLQPAAHVLICHGNGENVAVMAGFLRSMRDEFDVSIFAFDYRGYGLSEGSPHEAGVIADGHAAQAWLARRAGIELADIVVLGRSLGGAVAVDLAAANGARGLVLERTFTSLPDVAASLYWWAPVRLLMHNRYDSRSKIARYDGPLLQTHGTADEIIEFDIGKQLFDSAASKQKQFVEMAGVRHNDPSTREYLLVLKDFLQNLPLVKR